MSRSTTATFRKAIYSQETDEVFIVLIELSHPLWAETIRVCNDSVNIVSNGNTFIAFPFDIELPSDEEGDVPQARLVIDNVDQSLTASIRTITSPPSIRIMIILASNPDQIEVDYPDFILTNITYDATTITGTISVENFLNEPFPGDLFTPTKFPALF